MKIGDKVIFRDENGLKQVGHIIRQYPFDYTIGVYEHPAKEAITERVHYVTKEQIEHQ